MLIQWLRKNQLKETRWMPLAMGHPYLPDDIMSPDINVKMRLIHVIMQHINVDMQQNDFNKGPKLCCMLT